MGLFSRKHEGSHAAMHTQVYAKAEAMNTYHEMVNKVGCCGYRLVLELKLKPSHTDGQACCCSRTQLQRSLPGTMASAQ